MKILIIEDNPRLSDRMKTQLQRWFTTDIANTGHDGLMMISQTKYDAILVDLGLPDITGLEVCKHIRHINSSVPIMVVTGIDTTSSKVDLLDEGADDYVTKPFDIQEIRARINTLIRRSLKSEAIHSVKIKDLTLYPSSRKVFRNDIEIKLRKKEFDILEYLCINADRIMTREMIIAHAWPTNGNGWTGSVDVHIKQLRDKIDRPFDEKIIKTSYGVGYMINKN